MSDYEFDVKLICNLFYRSKNNGRLFVDYPGGGASRGDGTLAVDGTLTEEKYGQTDSGNIRSVLPPESTAFFIGGVPLLMVVLVLLSFIEFKF